MEQPSTGKKRLALLATFAALCPVSLACERQASVPEGVIAVVGSTEIAYADFQAFVEEALGEPGTDLDTAVLSALLDQYLLETQLRLLAIDRQLVDDRSSRRAALSALMSEVEESPVTESEVIRYYEEHRGDFELPDRVDLQQILVDDRELAGRLLSELRNGASFEELARAHSIDPNAPFGGGQGELAREDLPPAFADVIFELEQGEVSEILEANYGFHIFRVAARLPATVLSLDEVRPQVEMMLRTEAADRRWKEIVAEAEERYNVEVEGSKLPFSYDGTYSGKPDSE